MSPEKVAEAWARHKANPVSMELHPDDEMFNNGPDWYWSVGESGLRSVLGALGLAWLEEVRSVLDFGCGHGRVARHLVRAFPKAQFSYCERDERASQFCADTFGGDVVYDNALPTKQSLIWVGSVFTHLDGYAMQVLFRKLVDSLAPQGLLIATFHGRKAQHLQKTGMDYIDADRWLQIEKEYYERGVGYAEYEGQPGYGVSLTAPWRVMALADKDERLRLITYSEANWAEHQDVAAWAATPIDIKL